MSENVKRKPGENEAIQILEKKGYSFDKSHIDTGSGNSVPDLKFSDGRYLEVTHTFHNNSIPVKPNLFSKKSVKEQLSVMNAAKEAYDRIQNIDYEQNDNGDLTDKGRQKFHRDAALVKKHYGYDCTVWDFNQRFSEFNCDTPIIEMTSDNILREICEDKGKKHTDGNTDLFVYVLDGEMKAFKHLAATLSHNLASELFFNSVIKSPFKRVFICEWNFEKQEYIIDTPEMFLLEVQNDSVVWNKL